MSNQSVMHAHALANRSLLVRFGVMTVCALAVLGLAATFLLKGVVRTEGRSSARDQAVAVGELAVQQALSPADLSRGLDRQSRAALDQVARVAERHKRFSEITIRNRLGQVVYSSGSASADRNASDRFRVSVPIQFDSERTPAGRLEIRLPAQVATAGLNRATSRIYLTIAGLLFLLFAVLMPIVSRASRALRRQAAELRQQGDIVDATDDAVVSADREGIVTSWNPGAERLLGHRAEEMIGRPLGTLVPAARRAEQKSLLARVLRGETLDHFETTRLRKDGTEIEVSLTLSALRDDGGAITGVVDILRDVTERNRADAELKRYASELEALAIKDPLTEVLNHRAFHETVERELERCKREAGRCSVVMFDLDGFKHVNDTRGHAEGDRLLRAVADAIKVCCRPFDSVGRTGGDEFALLLAGATYEEGRSVGERVQGAVEAMQAGVGASFGVAEWPQAGPEKETLMFRADVELYAAKPSRRDGREVEAAGRAALASARGAQDEGAREMLGMARTEGIKRVLTIAREQLGMDIAYLSEFVDGEQVFRALAGDAESFGIEPGVGLPLEATYCQRMVAGRLPNVVNDAKREARVNALEITGDADVGAYIGVPVYLSGGRLYGTLCAASHAPNHELAERDVALLHVLARVLGDQLDHTELERELRRLDLEAGGIRALLVALEARDHYTGSHSECVVELSQLVARELEVTGDELVQVQQVALLHDIGKLGIPDAILQKPGQLGAREWELMREHPAIGSEIVGSIQPLAHLASPVRAEHERWDGRGYPDGLVGEEIPLASRIVFACDAYHAMTSDRPYRAALSTTEARGQLKANAGTQFDPTVVAALLHVVETSPTPTPSKNGRLT